MRGVAILLTAGAIVTATATAAAAAERVSSKPATQAFPFLADYYRLDPALRSRFAIAYRLQEKGRTVPARATLVDAGAETPLSTSPDGWFTRLPPAAALSRKAELRVVVSADSKPGIAVLPEVLMPAGAGEIEVAELTAASTQVAAVTRKMTGLLSFVAPKFTRVLFSGAEGASAVDAQGRATPLPLWRGTPVLDLTAAGSVKSVRFARAPYHALLAPPAS